MGADDGQVLDQLDRAISLNPRSAHLYASRGTVKAPHDNSGTLAEFSRAIDLGPDDGIVLDRAGVIRAPCLGTQDGGGTP